MTDRSPKRALAGIRVIATGHGYAVPWASRLLADMGAEVILLESPSYPHNLRLVGPYAESGMTGEFWNRAGYVHEIQRNKRGLTLDLAQPRGRELYKALVAKSDVVMENFAPRVMINLGLGYEHLRAVKPDIIMLSSTGFGHSGPYMNYAAWGDTLEPMSGVTAVSGEAERPMRGATTYTDVPAAYAGAFGVMAAIRHHRRTGEGQWIDLAQYQVGVSMVPQALMEWAINGRETPRHGNRHPVFAPHNTFPCAGEHRWVVVSVPDDACWTRLASVIGRPEWAADPRFGTVVERKRNEGEIDPAIAAWTRDKTTAEVFTTLQSERIPCSPVMNGRDIALDPHLNANGGMLRVRHAPPVADLGLRAYPGSPWRFSKTPPLADGQAPAFGEHCDEYLELLGVGPEEARELAAARVTGSEPNFAAFRHDNTASQKAMGIGAEGPIPGQDPRYRELLGLDQ